MSHRFKRSKQLGKGKQTMKSESAKSPNQSQPGLGSVGEGVYDFLYVDRARVSSLYAQLFPEGTLTGVKTTSQQGSSSDQNFGSDIKLIKAEIKSIDSESQGIERVFDPFWVIPLEVLAGLNDRSLIRFSFEDPKLGIISLLDGYLRIVDYASMKDIWEPAVTLFLGEGQAGVRETVGLIKSLPHVMHAHFLTDQGFLWSSLDPTNLTIPAADITLKHGAAVCGLWKVLSVLDAYPDLAELPDLVNWSAGEATNGVLTMMHGFRTQIGRPAGWFGVTPLMIYREISPASNQTSLELKPS